MREKNCELCNEEASLYCVSDAAFLCRGCDARVHEANFLVARHVRQLLCHICKGFEGTCFSGTCISPIRCLCRSCVSDSGEEEDSRSSSSACVSSAESFTARPSVIGPKAGKVDSSVSVVSIEKCLDERDRIRKLAKMVKSRRRFAEKEIQGNLDVKAEAVLSNWCKRLGLSNSCTLPLALHFFSVCLQKLPVLPFRICFAGSLWLSTRLCENKGQSCSLKKLEECCRLPAKFIVLAESKLAQILKLKKTQKEGWAECSD